MTIKIETELYRSDSYKLALTFVRLGYVYLELERFIDAENNINKGINLLK